MIRPHAVPIYMYFVHCPDIEEDQKRADAATIGVYLEGQMSEQKAKPQPFGNQASSGTLVTA